MPPTFFITTSRFTLPVGVGGVSTENQKNRIKTEANALRKVYAIFRLVAGLWGVLSYVGVHMISSLLEKEEDDAKISDVIKRGGIGGFLTL